MANQEHLAILKQGVEPWNQWRRDNPDILPDLSYADLREMHLEGAYLRRCNLLEANLFGTHLEGANLMNAILERADLRLAFFSNATRLNRANLGGKSKDDGASFADVFWGGANLEVVDWASIKTLGDEQKTRQSSTALPYRYRAAARANRQLSLALRDQGLVEEADRFAYRAQLLQRVVWRHQRKWLKYIFSWFLYLLAGYGYRPGRSLIAYLLLILGFAGAFYALGHLTWYEALVVSLTAFHGRGFFSQQYRPGDPQSMIAALEAVVGLLIEISLIATFTKRFFGS
jgi:hypothetical protein